MKPRAFHPEADEEYTHAVEYYTRINAEFGVEWRVFWWFIWLVRKFVR